MVPIRKLNRWYRYVARICANSTGLQFRPGEMFCNAILHEKQTWPRLEMCQGTGNVVITDRG